MDCIFCKIINGDLPSKKIYEDELVYAFMDIEPTVDGHVLLIPIICQIKCNIHINTH